MGCPSGSGPLPVAHPRLHLDTERLQASLWVEVGVGRSLLPFPPRAATGRLVVRPGEGQVLIKGRQPAELASAGWQPCPPSLGPLRKKTSKPITAQQAGCVWRAGLPGFRLEAAGSHT